MAGKESVYAIVGSASAHSSNERLVVKLAKMGAEKTRLKRLIG